VLLWRLAASSRNAHLTTDCVGNYLGVSAFEEVGEQFPRRRLLGDAGEALASDRGLVGVTGGFGEVERLLVDLARFVDETSCQRGLGVAVQEIHRPLALGGVLDDLQCPAVVDKCLVVPAGLAERDGQIVETPGLVLQVVVLASEPQRLGKVRDRSLGVGASGRRAEGDERRDRRRPVRRVPVQRSGLPGEGGSLVQPSELAAKS
jgi:hypothetical protein